MSSAVAALFPPRPDTAGTLVPVAAEPGAEDDGVAPGAEPLTSGPELPAPLRKPDGTRISTRSERCRRRAEIRKPAERHVHGQRPAPSWCSKGGRADRPLKGSGAAVISLDPYALGREGTPRGDEQSALFGLYGSSGSTGLLMAWPWAWR
ncbi:hypothetical protein ACFFUA_19730 [Streptomyces heliomycini]|uniref:4-O-methyl-glucuronoyl methylesterase-like domain-containing protein n=1 Tax=Streptomyces heliomycini TaxID=284032 RepID=A0ABV5LBU5_9ACTN